GVLSTTGVKRGVSRRLLLYRLLSSGDDRTFRTGYRLPIAMPTAYNVLRPNLLPGKIRDPPMKRPTWLLGIAALLLTGRTDAQTSYPMITHVTPVAVQTGQTTEVTVAGQMNFHGVYKAIFEGTGITAEVVDKPAAVPAGSQPPLVRSVKLKLTVAADAAPGVREFRVASSLGISSIGQLLVTEYPVVSEKGDNNTRATANPIVVPCVVSGRIEAAEDVDFYKFHADEGQALTFEVICARIQDKIHDLQKHAVPMLTPYDAEGRELAANDDFYFADPWLTYKFSKSGDYFIQVRDAKYDGDQRWVYALLVSDRPHITHLYPMAGNPGQSIDVESIGSAHVAGKHLTVTASAK